MRAMQLCRAFVCINLPTNHFSKSFTSDFPINRIDFSDHFNFVRLDNIAACPMSMQPAAGSNEDFIYVSFMSCQFKHSKWKR